MRSGYESGLRISEYVLEERVGAGSFGEVWRARHHIWKDDHVAVKLPTEPEYVRYLQREGIVVHGLRHPNIVRVLGLDPYADVPYLVMELVDGPSLRQAITDNPNGMKIETAVTALRGILWAMAIAHDNGVLHRDLKPGNVLLHLGGKSIDDLEEDDVKVSDFGLGVGDPDALKEIVQSASIDRESKLVGTMAYMAPELRDGHEKPSAKSDLYSIGVILFELLTGERPAGAELPSTLRADVPQALDNVFQRLYVRHDRRYESAKEVLDELDAAFKQTSSIPLPPPLPAAQGGTRGDRHTCSSCGHVTETGDQFCTQCGHQIVEVVRRCRACGGYPGVADTYCIHCGARLPAGD